VELTLKTGSEITMIPQCLKQPSYGATWAFLFELLHMNLPTLRCKRTIIIISNCCHFVN
jgi:hypothetical protein